MRFLRILSLSAGGLFLSCADDGGGGKVNPDINWIVGCTAGSSGCGTGRSFHNTTFAPKSRFSVSCHKVGQIIEFVITDPGSADDPKTLAPMNEEHPGSSIEVSNGNTTAGTCDVTVRDSPAPFGSPPLTFYGKCRGSSAMPSCDLQGAFNVDGYVWKGTLKCEGLELQNSGAATRYTLAAENGGPVPIAVDNCD
jgi:hypothetical protein